MTGIPLSPLLEAAIAELIQNNLVFLDLTNHRIVRRHRSQEDLYEPQDERGDPIELWQDDLTQV